LTPIATIRREQIIDAAIGIIVEQGLPSLSLSKIEERAGMSRGQLTHYFPTKEDILLAVFDRMIATMHQRAIEAGMPPPQCSAEPKEIWPHFQLVLGRLIGQPPIWPEFNSLHYTFMSQIGHRDDFRQRLASLYEHWRTMMTTDLGNANAIRPPGAGNVSHRVMASFIQAIIHGVMVQLDADPDAFDRGEMLQLVLAMLAPWMGVLAPETPPRDDHE